MDKYLEELFNQMHDLCHRIQGYIDAKHDLKPNLRFVEDDEPKVISFPGGEKIKKTDVGETSDIEQGFVYFTEQEIEQMSITLQKIFIVNKNRCHARKIPSGNGYTYELRFRKDGYNVSACGKTIQLAKANMLRKLRKAKPTAKQNTVGFPDTFHSFAMYYFEEFRKERITPMTYYQDMQRYKRHLQPHFGETKLKNITPFDCKQLVDSIKQQGKSKTANEVYSMMSIIFKGAIRHNIIQQNPLLIVPPVHHDRKNGTALSREEEQILFDGLSEPKFKAAAALVLYCGLRPNELETAKIEGPFIVARNSKRKNGKIEYKKIPIIEKLKPFITDGLPKLKTVESLYRRVKRILPNHKLYDLRTTFYTRCDELGVAVPARDAYVGHSAGALTNAYRDLSDAYLLEEGTKLNQW